MRVWHACLVGPDWLILAPVQGSCSLDIQALAVRACTAFSLALGYCKRRYPADVRETSSIRLQHQQFCGLTSYNCLWYTNMSYLLCRHTDVRFLDGLSVCLACGELYFNDPDREGSNLFWEEEYSYPDLRRLKNGDTIRLISVAPGDFADPIVCTMQHFSLETINYDAISYAWATESGEDSRSQRIYIDHKTIHVTRNCEAALR